MAIYTRVSTEDQANEGYSLQAQRERLEAYCEAQGWEISGHYVDEGNSGRNTRRPEYQRMMEERDSWDLILVLKMDRIHRNSKNFMIMMENLERWDKKFASMQESLDTSNAVGRFVVDIIQRIAQLESEQIGERTYLGMRQKAESSMGLLGFNPPFGYAIGPGRLLIVPDEAAIVEEIFHRYLKGGTMEGIARSLNHNDIVTRKGNQWTVWSISRILRNPVYAGFLRWDGIFMPNHHTPIVSVKDFNRVQSIVTSRTRSRNCCHTLELPRDAIIVEEEEEAQSIS